MTLSSTLIFAACGKKAIENAQAESNSNRPAERIDVAVAPVVERAAVRGIEVVGSFEADDVTVSSQGAGNLDEITVDVGSQVRRGQTIARIDPADGLASKRQEIASHRTCVKITTRTKAL